jgi:hypothetical protein
LRAECAEILFALRHARSAEYARWEKAANWLFGSAGSGDDESARLRVGDARLPRDLRDALADDFRPLLAKRDKERESEWGFKRAENLESLTAIRRQTALDPQTGAPMEETLRTMRVILRGTPFEATLDFREPPSEDALALLAACVKAFRRAGTGRNRGRGRLRADLYDASGQTAVTEKHFARVRAGVNP